MPTSRTVKHYAPGSNRVSIAVRSNQQANQHSTAHVMRHPLTLDEQIMIQSRLRRRFIEEDGQVADPAGTELAASSPRSFNMTSFVSWARSLSRQPFRLVRQQ